MAKHVCDDCGKECKRPYDLMRHRESQHNPEKDAVCPVGCGRTVSNARLDKQRLHMRKNHAGETATQPWILLHPPRDLGGHESEVDQNSQHLMPQMRYGAQDVPEASFSGSTNSTALSSSPHSVGTAGENGGNAETGHNHIVCNSSRAVDLNGFGMDPAASWYCIACDCGLYWTNSGHVHH